MNVMGSKATHYVVLMNLNNGDGKTIPVAADDIVESSENIVRNIFESNNFHVVKMNHGMNYSKFMEKENSREWMLKRIENRANTDLSDVAVPGIPDFAVGKKSERKFSFVEVKKAGTTLRDTQMHWFAKFDNQPLQLAFVFDKATWKESSPYN